MAAAFAATGRRLDMIMVAKTTTTVNSQETVTRGEETPLEIGGKLIYDNKESGGYYND